MPCQQGRLTGRKLPLHPLERVRLVVVCEGGTVHGEGTHQVVLVQIQNLQKEMPGNSSCQTWSMIGVSCREGG